MLRYRTQLRPHARAMFFSLLALVLAASSFPAMAQGRGQRSRDADRQLRALLAPVVESVRPSVVTVVGGDEVRGLGTVVDGRGYVLAKASELVDVQELVCRTSEGEEFAARLIGVDRSNDLALLHIDAEGLAPVKWGDSEVEIGSMVIVAGPDERPIRAGIVSTQPRRVAPHRLVLGVMLAPDGEGLVVTNLTDGFGAAQAGIEVGDIITHMMGEKVAAIQQVVASLQDSTVGDRVAVSLIRDGDPVELEVELREMQPDPGSRGERMNRMGGEISRRHVGFQQVLQHDAEIRPIDCGGPLVNLDGEVVGLNIARAGRIATYALPASLVIEKVEELIALDNEPAISQDPS